MSALPTDGLLYSATIGGVEVNRPDRAGLNLHVMRGKAPRRRDSETLDGVDGVRTYPSFRTDRTESLRFLFVGTVDGDGVATTDPAAGLEDALEAFDAEVYGATPDERGQVELVLTSTRTGRSWSGPITLDDFRVNRDDESASETVGILTVTLVDGELAEVGS